MAQTGHNSCSQSNNRSSAACNISLSPSELVFPGPQGPAPALTEDNNSIIVSGNDFRITFRKSDGLLEQGIFKGKEILKDGSYFNLVGGSPLKK